jgi:outer membrane immunogenic protein
MKKLFVAAALAGLVGTANAQSAFEGAYGQIGIGYESVSPTLTNQQITIPSIQAAAFNWNASSSSANSIVGVFTLGYNHSINKEFLLGIGIDYSPFAGSKGNYTLSNGTLGSSPGYYQKLNSYNIFISPGYAIDKDKLAYAKVGYTGASTKSDGTYTTNYTGYSLGLGYKQIIQGGLYGFAEGNYMSYGNKSINDSGTTDSGRAYTSSGTSSANAYNFLVGVGYRF